MAFETLRLILKIELSDLVIGLVLVDTFEVQWERVIVVPEVEIVVDRKWRLENGKQTLTNDQSQKHKTNQRRSRVPAQGWDTEKQRG